MLAERRRNKESLKEKGGSSLKGKQSKAPALTDNLHPRASPASARFFCAFSRGQAINPPFLKKAL
jgi:hypothetical protein